MTYLNWFILIWFGVGFVKTLVFAVPYLYVEIKECIRYRVFRWDNYLGFIVLCFLNIITGPIPIIGAFL